MKAEREEKIIPPAWPVECIEVRCWHISHLRYGAHNAYCSIGFPHRSSSLRGVTLCAALDHSFAFEIILTCCASDEFPLPSCVFLSLLFLPS